MPLNTSYNRYTERRYGAFDINRRKKVKRIKAKVLTDWNKTRNPGCKFYPGDLAKVHKSAYSSDLANSYVGRIGIVIAVTGCPKQGLIRYETGIYGQRRATTRYYLMMKDSEILSIGSPALEQKLEDVA